MVKTLVDEPKVEDHQWHLIFSSARIEKKIEKAGNLELLEGVKDINWLLVSTPLKNMKVKWDYYSQYIYIYTQDVLLPCQTHKNTVNYSVWAFETR